MKTLASRSTMALSADAAQLSSLLAVLTQPDTEAIRQAEVALKPLLKDPRCVPALVEILKAKDSQVSFSIRCLRDHLQGRFEFLFSRGSF